MTQDGTESTLIRREYTGIRTVRPPFLAGKPDGVDAKRTVHLHSPCRLLVLLW